MTRFLAVLLHHGNVLLCNCDLNKKMGVGILYKIVKKRDLNPTVCLMEVLAPTIAKKALAGQFIILKIDEFGERIPLTVADYDREQGTITIIFQKVGKTTLKLGDMNEGDFIQDFVGPLGIASHFDGMKRVAVVGGGVGCAIAYPQAKALHNLGAHVDLIAGFRSKDIVILEEEMEAACTNLHLCTDDGSYKEKALVTDVLRRLIESGEKYDAVIAIGPLMMMKFVSALTKEYGIKTIVSMNPIMIDGTGMCGGCRLTVGGEVKFACVDGPDFDGHQVDYDEAIRRSAVFKGKQDHDRDEYCNLMKGVK